MLEGFNDCLFLIPRCLRRPTALSLRQIIVLPLNNPAFPLRLRDIQVRHMKSVLLLHPVLDLFVCSLTLSCGYVQLIHIHLDADMMLRFRKFGQSAYRLNMPGDVAMNVNGKAELIMIKFVIPNKSIN